MLSKMIGSLALTAAMLLGPAVAADSSAQSRGLLSRSLPLINLSGVSFKDSVDFLRDVSGLNIHVNWKAIEAAGVSADTPITIKLRDVTVRKALALVLNEASGGTGLAFYIDDGIVEITTRQVADAQMSTVVYPVQDLLFDPPAVELPPDFAMAGRVGGRGAAHGANGANGAWGKNQAPQIDPKAQDLITLITETIQPEAWNVNGGKASIKYFSGQLIVTAPRSIHEAIGGVVE